MYPFEVEPGQLEANLDHLVDTVFSSLVSDFLTMPRGEGFVEYPVFELGYETIKRKTKAFREINCDNLLAAAFETQIAVVVVRSILGFTPPEWAYVATQKTGESVSQGSARSLDRRIRMNPCQPLKVTGLTLRRVKALMSAAAQLMIEGAPNIGATRLHRLNKADTCAGRESIAAVADIGLPYAMLLYERFLGRPFAGHRDSVSELVGDSLESAIEDVLSAAGISYRKTKRAEKIPGFDQSPDFVIPSEFSPSVVIEAKLTEDDGTARDKITRIQHLGEIGASSHLGGQPKFEVVACIAGRGFGVRREDMKKLILATQGKVFTQQHLEKIVQHTSLGSYKTK